MVVRFFIWAITHMWTNVPVNTAVGSPLPNSYLIVIVTTDALIMTGAGVVGGSSWADYRSSRIQILIWILEFWLLQLMLHLHFPA